MATEVKQGLGKCLGKSTDNSTENCMENELPEKKRPKILLSYVRQESEEKVIELKRQLETHGLKHIFLDLNEIKVGDDWADVLNKAILNCDVFIALVSSQYGITKWTKREIKLADLKDKHIIPINFLDDWPPDCLAIQLACTQYIKWEPNVGKIAKVIKVHLQKNFIESDSEFISEGPISPCKRPRYPDDHNRNRGESSDSDELPNLPIGSLNINQNLSKIEDYERPKGKARIVISSHNKQKDFIEFLRQVLSEYEFDNWSDGCEDMSIDNHSLNFSKEICGKNFKSEADAASLVIIVLSESYCLSKICKQQAFYCDYRTKVIPIQFEQFENPEWLSDMFTEDKWGTPSADLEWLSYVDNNLDEFTRTLKNRIAKLID